jgi:transposase
MYLTGQANMVNDENRDLRNRERRLTADITSKENQLKELDRQQKELETEKRRLDMEEKRLKLEKDELIQTEKLILRKRYEMETDLKFMEKSLDEVNNEIRQSKQSK